MAEMGFSQEMKMQQALSPQLYQSMEILQMSLMDLQQLVKQELSANPTLEAQQPEADAQIEVETGTQDAEQFDAEMVALGDDWSGERSSGLGSDAEEKHQFLMESLSEGASLQEQLLEQLMMVDLDAQERGIAELLIGNIDDEGYLQLDLEEMMERPDFPVEMFERVLRSVQGMDPAGVGARDLRECLLLQLERAGETGGEAYALVHDHLDLLGRNRLEEMAGLMELPLERITVLAERVVQLDPKPGLQLSVDAVEMVTPEIFVEEVEGELRVRSNRKPYPRLFLNPRYLELLKDKGTPAETKAYIREKLAKSRLMIQSIDQRISMIEQIAGELVTIQRGFFEQGVEGLRPLNMRTVAERLEVHETTVSRAVAGKYMETPRGLLAMKYFFKPGVRTVSGELVSNEHAKTVLADIIAQEDRKKPYSDARLVALLKERDINISRRTVAKYRDQLKILSSHLRRVR
ncbi:MAG: RNA polymerase sigma-54 factor [Kiritimatiellaceae bacterium]|nr:MAG: RNA polymerase sigma-54 factor [Kiritimatiellaceae bacterium]|tara:strand:+ start:450 stop:1838 length:1389 start_codon:yes stop_codon:yes gene_type:complete